METSIELADAERLIAEVEALRAENECLQAALELGPEAVRGTAGTNGAGSHDDEGDGEPAQLVALEQQFLSLQAQAAQLADSKRAADAAVAALTNELVSTRTTANMVLYRLLEEMNKSTQHHGGSGIFGVAWPAQMPAVPMLGVGSDWGHAAMMAAMQMQTMQHAMQVQQHPMQQHSAQPTPPKQLPWKLQVQELGGSGQQDAQEQIHPQPEPAAGQQRPSLGRPPLPQPKHHLSHQQRDHPPAKKARSRDEAPGSDQAAQALAQQLSVDASANGVAMVTG